MTRSLSRLVLLTAVLVGAIFSTTAFAQVAPVITKSFAPAVVDLNGASVATITVTNPNAQLSLTNVQFSDTMPAGINLITQTGGTCSTPATGGGMFSINPGTETFSSTSSVLAGGQSLLAVLMSFAITSAILGAFSPLLAFVVWNAPAMSPDVKSTLPYALIKLTHVVVIAFAGVAGTVRLFQLLTQLGGGKTVAKRVLIAWLAVNLLLGSQLTWIARPFIGAPQLPVAFLREGAFKGNFYENVFSTLTGLFDFD